MQDLAKFFATVGFKIDKKQLTDLEKSLKSVEASLKTFVSAFDATVGKVERGLAKTQMAQKRQLDIEGKQIRNITLRQKAEAIAAKTREAVAKATANEARATEKLNNIKAKADNQSTFRTRATSFTRALRAGIDPSTVGGNFSTLGDRYKLSVEGAERLAHMKNDRKDSWSRQGKAGFMGAGVGSEAAHWMRGFLPGFGAAWSIASLNSISQELNGINNAMLSVTGSAEAAGKEMQFLNTVGREYGLTLRQIAPDYAGFVAAAKGTKLEGNTQQGFGQLLKYTQVMGMSGEDTKGSLIAIQQMMGKRKIMSEELKGQLAEHMKGAIPLMAQAAGMSVQQLLNSSGQLNSDEILPKFFALLAKQAELGWSKYLKSSQYAQGVFRKQWEETVEKLAKSGFDTAVARFFNKLTGALTESGPLVKGLGVAFDLLGSALSVPVELIGNMLGYFEQLNPTVQKSVLVIGGLTTGIWFLNTAFGAMFAKLTLVLLGLATLSDLLAFAQGKNSAIGDALDKKNWMELVIYAITLAGALATVFGWLSKIGGLGKTTEVAKDVAKGGIVRSLAGLVARNPIGATLVAAAGIGAYAYSQTSAMTLDQRIAEQERLKSMAHGKGEISYYQDRIDRLNQFRSNPSPNIQSNPTFEFNITTDNPLAFHDYFKENMQKIHNDALLIFPRAAQ